MTDKALQIAVEAIAGFEGFRAGPYPDAGGTWTIGYGFTYLEDGGRVTAETPPITETDARARLSPMVGRVMALVRGMVHRPMTDNQAAALTSFAYNLGTNALRTSTLLRLFEAGEVDHASTCFGAWVHCDGRVLAGLVKRRAAEAALFLKPDDVPVAEPQLPIGD